MARAEIATAERLTAPVPAEGYLPVTAASTPQSGPVAVPQQPGPALTPIAAKLEAIDAERQRIGRELHDGAAQIITAAIFLLDHCLEAGSGVSAEVRASLHQARQMLDETTVELYRLVSDLRPRIVEDLGLVDAVDCYVQRWARETGVRVACELDATVCLAPETEASLFRILQEALANVRKHAAATRVVVSIRRGSGRVVITVRDNGRGIQASRQGQGPGALGGNGLTTMFERATLLGGELEVFSVPEIGTQITVRVPDSQSHNDGGYAYAPQTIQPMEDAPCLVSG